MWLRALRSRNGYDPSWPDPRPWLYGIARNLLYAHWRLRSHDPRPAQELVVDPWAEVDTGLDAARLRPVLLDALACLSDDDREVLMLVAWEQLTPAEAAISLSIPQGTARCRLHRARNILQRQLDTLPSPDCPQQV